VLGWDAVGTVEANRAEVSGRSKAGDRVYYAGAVNAGPACNAEYHSGRRSGIVGRAPASLSDARPRSAVDGHHRLGAAVLIVWCCARAAVLAQTMLVIGAAGGVGSIRWQLARQLTQTETVVATAIAAKSVQWVRRIWRAPCDRRTTAHPGAVADIGIRARVETGCLADATQPSIYEQIYECPGAQGIVGPCR